MRAAALGAASCWRAVADRRPRSCSRWGGCCPCGVRGDNHRRQRLDRERQRRQPARNANTRGPASEQGHVVEGHERRAAAMTCGWCGGPSHVEAGADPEVVLRHVSAPGRGSRPGLRPPAAPRWSSSSGASKSRYPSCPPAATGPDCSASSSASLTTGGSTTATCPLWRGQFSPYWRLTGDAHTSPALPTCSEPRLQLLRKREGAGQALQPACLKLERVRLGWTGDVLKAAAPRLWDSRHAASRDLSGRGQHE